MTTGFGFILRAIPFAMLCFCATFGLLLLLTGDPGSVAAGYIAGHVVAGLSAICLALFCTASVLVRLLLRRLTAFECVFYPALGYAGAASAAWFGYHLWHNELAAYAFVAGHVVFGLGCIAGCVSTVALASCKFAAIPRNAHPAPDAPPPAPVWPAAVARSLYALPVIIAANAWAFALPLVWQDQPPHSVAGHVLGGLAAICTCLIGLVVSVVRQEQGTYNDIDRYLWPIGTVTIGLGCMAAGGWLLATTTNPLFLAPGWVLPGLGLVCWSILSKTWLLAANWRRSPGWINHIPLIPTFTALLCLFMAAFLFQAETWNPGYFIPARVVAGLGAICFTLFSIVSLLESGATRSGGGR